MDDTELLDRWCAGDPRAGDALFRRHFDAVYRFFETKCARLDADELTQATFLACVAGRARFRRAASFRTYLFTIARNQLYRRLRAHYRHDAKLDFARSSIAELVTTPATRLARAEEHERLVEVLQALPVETQILLELHYREDLALEELAEVFGVSNQVIRTRLSRARKLLRERLGHNDAPLTPPGTCGLSCGWGVSSGAPIRR